MQFICVTGERCTVDALARLFTLDALSSDDVTAMGERLNLWAAKTEVEMHGGKLAAYPAHHEPSAPGAAAAAGDDGVVFVVELPMSRPAMGDTPPTVRSEVVASPTNPRGDAVAPFADDDDDDDGDRESIVYMPAFPHHVVMARLSNSEGGCGASIIVLLSRSPHSQSTHHTLLSFFDPTQPPRSRV